MKKVIIKKYRNLVLRILAIIVALSPIGVIAQNNGVLNGKVVDEYGNPVAGVLINISGVAEDVMTDVDGAFKVVNDPNVVVSLYHKNYLKQEFKLGNVKHPEKPYVVVLTEKNYKNDNIIHGAYRDYDKESFLGSETSIYNNQLTKTMSSTIIPGMMGRAAGLNIYQYRGARLHMSTRNTGDALLFQTPNYASGVYSDNSEFAISSRGQGPIVIIDGIERDFYSIDPEAIESVSIQKDALSSLFLGMRSSRGAMIITTKNPKQEGFQLSFTGRWGFTSTIKKPKPLDSYRYAYLLNEALANDGMGTFYTQSDFLKFRDGSSPYTHPNVNWFDEVIDDGGSMQSYNVNVSGGNKFAQYFVNLGYFGEDGIFKQTDLDNYNTKLELERYLINSKVNINITDDFSAMVSVIGRVEEGNQPGGSGTGYSDILASIYRTPNGAYPIKNPNGTWGGNVSYNTNLMAQTLNSGYIIDNARDILASANLKYDFDKVVKGLSVRAVGSITAQNRSMTFRTKQDPVYQYTQKYDEEGNLVEGYNRFGTISPQSNSFRSVTTYQQMYGQLAVDYERQWGDHGFAASVSGDTRQVLTDYNLPEIPSNVMGNVSYNYQNKYFAQAALTESYYNRFAHGKRWGTFWAGGLGWDISKESFMDDVEWIDQLKLRGVYGRTGNIGAIGYYTYSQSFTENLFGGYNQGTSQAAGGLVTENSPLANPNITWEKADKINVGVDFVALNDRLRVTADYYNDKYFDLLQARGKSIAIMGQNYPNENIGKIRRWGGEITVTWQDGFRDFNYYISANWSTEQTERLYMDEQWQPYDYLYRTGKSTGAVWGYECLGFYQSKEDIAQHNATISGYTPIPGDLKYKDQNNDGVINEFDQVAIYGDRPTGYFGLDYGFSWKGIEFSMMWQGCYNRDIYLSDYAGCMLGCFFNVNQHYAQGYESMLGRWTPETAETATLPRLSAGSNANNYQTSDFWVRNGNFIRLRDITLAYTLPKSFSRNYLGGLNAKVFVNGQNLLTFAGCDLIDPEVSFTSYPLQRVISMGVNLKF